MSEAFDPYYKWLGISPKDQPTNYYRLLGVPLFESDSEVIEHAADRQMAHVRTFQSGQYAEFAQQILNVVSRARVCLLDPEKKAAYDAKLKEQLAAAKTTGPPPRKTAMPAQKSAGPVISTSASTSSPRRRGKKEKKVPASKKPWFAAVAVVGLILILGGVYWVVSKEDPDKNEVARQEDEPTGGEAKTQDAKQPDAPPENSTPEDPQAPTDTKENGASTVPEDTKEPEEKDPTGPTDEKEPETNTPKEPLEPPEPTDVTEPVDPNPEKKEPLSPFEQAAKEKEATEPVLTEPEEPTIEPEPVVVEKMAVPSAAKQQESRELIVDLYKDKLGTARTPTQKVAVAKEFYTEGMATKDDAAGRFVLLGIAKDLSTDAGDIETALFVLREITKSFEVDADFQTDALDKVSKSARTPAQNSALIGYLNTALLDAVKTDRFDLARKLGDLARGSARKTKDFKLLKEVTDGTKKITDLEKKYNEVKQHFDTLKANPEDPVANYQAGKYRSFVNGNWKVGLPMLAKGSNPTLKTLAEKDLAKPTAYRDQVKLGDGWWDLSEKLSDGIEKNQIRLHAGKWYRKALPELKGLAKVRIEKRLKQLPASENAAPVKPYFLDDMSEVSFQVYRDRLGKHGNKGWERGKGKVNGNVFQHALSVHPPKSGSPSVIEYALDGHFTSFSAVAALWDGASPRDPLIFKVIGDDKVLWQSQPINKTGPQQCKVSLKGVKTLRLLVDCPESYSSAHTVWLNPQVVGSLPKKTFAKIHPVLKYEMKKHPEGATRFSGNAHYFKAFYEKRITWQKAAMKCKQMGGYLACPETVSEAQFVGKLAKGSTYWLGGVKNARGWFWIVGIPLTRNQAYFYKGEPNNRGGKETCLMTYSRDGKWADAPPDYSSIRGYICEWEH